MNQVYQAKVKELLIEFTHYLMEYPEWGAKIPANAQIVLLDSHDPVYSHIVKLQSKMHIRRNRPMMLLNVRLSILKSKN